MAKTKNRKKDTGANLGVEAKLWQAADALRWREASIVAKAPEGQRPQ